MSVLATDGEQRSTLAVVRALGGAGIPVTVGSSQPNCLAGSSRFCAGTVRYPPPEQGEEFVRFLLAELKRGQHRVLLPMSDLTMLLISSFADSLSSLVSLPIPGKDQVDFVQDKRQVLLLARTMGIPCPETYMLGDEEKLEEVARIVQYPVVIKPRRSRAIRDGRVAIGAVRYAHDEQTLLTEYRRLDAQTPRPMVQEKIEGEGRGIFLLIWNGALKAAFCHRRLREMPPWGGASVYSESLPLDEMLVEKSYSLLKAIGWQGVAMVEYKLDRRDGKAKLMEVNGRFWGSLQLAIDAGMNFPLMLYRLASGEDVPPKFEYKIGARSRWLLGDLDHLLTRLTYSGPMNGSHGCRGSRSQAIVDFLKFYQRGLRYEVFRLDDPAPGWFELKKLFRDGFHRLRRRREAVRGR